MPPPIILRCRLERGWFKYTCPVCKQSTGAMQLEGRGEARRSILCHLNRGHFAWWLQHGRRVQAQ